MEKQKICIIGGGLSGLLTAVTLSKLNLKIDLVTTDISQNIKTSRTIAISQHNYDFLKKLNILKFKKKSFWPCTKVKLYTKDEQEKLSEIFKLNGVKHQKGKIFYMVENSKIAQELIQNVKKNKLISFKVQKITPESIRSGYLQSVKFSKKNSSKYNLIIICTGSDSELIKNLFNHQVIRHTYKEISITTILKHSSLTNNTARQIFLNNEILALLPISNNKTSVVWSVKKSIVDPYKKNISSFFKQKIKHYTKNFLKNIKFNSTMEFKDLNFLIRKKYYQNRVLLFGDALHAIHPFVGQGFNMTLRDLKSLKKILKHKINLGLDIGSPDILEKFSRDTRSGNFAYTLGADFIKKSFSIKERSLQNIRNEIIKYLNKNDFIKKQFFNVADKGIKF